jgi:hypothetical protein
MISLSRIPKGEEVVIKSAVSGVLSGIIFSRILGVNQGVILGGTVGFGVSLCSFIFNISETDAIISLLESNAVGLASTTIACGLINKYAFNQNTTLNYVTTSLGVIGLSISAGTAVIAGIANRKDLAKAGTVY